MENLLIFPFCLDVDGFGEKGKLASASEGAVPPNATLIIALELVSWKTVSEVTDDKKVIKKILKEGEGFERPNEGSAVKVKLIGKLENGTVFIKKGHGEGEELFEFKTDEGNGSSGSKVFLFFNFLVSIMI